MTTLALAFALLQQDPDLRDAGRALRDAFAANNAAAAEPALRTIVRANSKEAMELLLEQLRRLTPDNDQIYWLSVRAAASFNDPEAMEELGEYVTRNRGQPIARDIAATIRANINYGVVPFVIALLSDGTDDLVILACQHAAEIVHRDLVDPLIGVMRDARRNSEIRRQAHAALTTILGRDIGDDADAWQAWWDQNREMDLGAGSRERRSTGTCVDGLDQTREGEYRRLREVDPEKIVVLAGSECARAEHNLDHIENVLSRMEVPHIVVTKVDFSKPEFTTADRIAILANCTMWRRHCVCPDCKVDTSMQTQGRLRPCQDCNRHIECEDVLPSQGVEKAKRFVEDGGYLFSEDWAMADLLQRAWEGIVQEGRGLRTQHEGTCTDHVEIFPAPGAVSHPYLRQVFTRIREGGDSLRTVTSADLEDVRLRWKIDDESPAIRIMDESKVTVLMTCPELTVREAESEAVALTFFPGSRRPPFIATGGFENDRGAMTGGRVLHVLSHFGKQESEQAEHTLQNLMLNFLLEANERYLRRQP